MWCLCLRCGVVDGCGGKEAKVVVVGLWLFGNDVGGGDLVAGGWLVQNNDRKKKNGYLKGSQPGEHEEFPLNNCGEIYLHINLPA